MSANERSQSHRVTRALATSLVAGLVLAPTGPAFAAAKKPAAKPAKSNSTSSTSSKAASQPSKNAKPKQAAQSSSSTKLTRQRAEVTVRDLGSDMQKSAASRKSAVFAVSDVRKAVSAYPNPTARPWERGVSFSAAADYSARFGDVSYQLSADSKTMLLAVAWPGGCTMARFGVKGSVTVWSYGDLGRNCVAGLAKGGPGQKAPVYVDPTPPGSVSSLSGTRGDGQVSLHWTAPADNDLASYNIYVCPEGSTPKLVATVAATSSSMGPVVVAGLTNDVTYQFCVQAVDEAGNTGPLSAAVELTPTDLTAPAAPVDLAVVPGDESLSVSWRANVEEDLEGYLVYVNGALVKSVPAGVESVELTGLVNGTSYEVSVAAIDGHNNVSPRTAVVAASPVDAVAPDAPIALTAAPGDSVVDLKWEAPAAADVDHYIVVVDGTEVAEVRDLAFHLDGLTNGQTYVFEVIAVDEAGNRSTPAGPVEATPVDMTAPDAPLNLTGTAGDASAHVSWDPVVADDLDHYLVTMTDAAGLETQFRVLDATELTVLALSNDSEYTFVVVAVDRVGNASSPSNAVTLVPVDTTAPESVVGLTADAGDATVDVAWTQSVSDDVVKQVLRVSSPNGELVFEHGAEVTGQRLQDLVNGVTYTFVVEVFDAAGNSTVSEPVQATPADTTAPDAAQALAAEAGDTQVELTWTPSTTPDAATQEIVVSSAEGVKSVLVDATASSLFVSGLTNLVEYTFTVVTTDEAGNSSTSEPATAVPADTTAPATPADFAGEAADGALRLSWSPNTEDDLEGYTLTVGDRTFELDRATSSFVVDGLQNGQPLTVSLVARDEVPNRSSAAVLELTPADTTAPAAPIDVAADAGDSAVRVSWSASTDADVASYQVFVDGALYATVDAAVRVVDVVALQNDVEYLFSVAAVDGAGNISAQSTQVAATPRSTVVDEAPTAPTGVTAVGGDRTIAVTWDRHVEADVTSYQLSLDGAVVATVPADVTEYQLTGLASDTKYTVAVRAVDAAGQVSEPGSATAQTLDLEAPAAPSDVVAEPGTNQVALTWSRNTEPDVVEYRVQVDGGTPIKVGNVTTYTVTSLANGREYSFRVFAVDDAGNVSEAAGPVTATPVDITAPGTPSGLRGVGIDHGINVRWYAVNAVDLAGYEVWVDGALAVTVTGDANFTDVHGLVNWQTYAVQVLAFDTSGNRSPLSAPVDVTAGDATAPFAPLGLQTKVNGYEVTLTWDPVTVSDLDYYEIEMDGAVAMTVPAGTHQAVFNGFTDGQKITFVMYAYDKVGNKSKPSSPVGAQIGDNTPPPAPSDLVGMSGDTSATLGWLEPADVSDIVDYVIYKDGLAVGVAPVGTTEYLATKLTNGVEYRFEIAARDGAKNLSTLVGPVSVVPADTIAPVVPSGLTAETGNGTIKAIWEPVRNDVSLAGYYVYLDGVHSATVSGATEHLFTGLVNDRPYSISVAAFDTSGNVSDRSAELVIGPRYAGVRDDFNRPDATGLGETTEGARFWAYSAGEWSLVNGAAQNNSLAVGVAHVDTLISDATVSVTVSNAGSTDAYGVVGRYVDDGNYLKVQRGASCGTAGERVLSLVKFRNKANFVLGSACVPTSSSERLTLGMSGTSLTVVVNGATVITAADDFNITSERHGVIGNHKTGTRFDDFLVGGQAGNGIAPLKPHTVTAVPAAGQLTVGWSAPGDTDLDSFKVYRDGVLVATAAADVRQHTMSGLTDGQSYKLQVVAVDWDGNESPLSQPLMAEPGKTAVLDGFDRADGVIGTAPIGAQVWSDPSKVWYVEANRARVRGAAGTFYTALLNAGTSDGTFEVSMQGASSSERGGVVFRSSDDRKNQWRFVRDHASGCATTSHRRWSLVKVVNGTASTVGVTCVLPTSDDRLSATAIGTTITVSLNGQVLYSVEDAHAATNTGAGIYASGGDQVTRWENFKVVRP